MQRTTRILLLTLLASAGCKAIPKGSSTPPYVLTWTAAPAPIMVRQYDPAAPTLPCVTVHVSSSAGAQPGIDGGPYLVEGAPLKGIDVKLGKNPGGGCAARTSDDNGDVQFCGIPFDPGAYTLNAAADGADTLQSAPFLVPEASIALTWTVQPQIGILGQPLAGVNGECPTVTATQLVDVADGGAPPVPYLVEGAPLKGIDVKLGKNPGGGCAARTTTDENGVAQFCNVMADQVGSVTYTAALSLPDGGDVPEQFDPLYLPVAKVVSNPLYVSPNQLVLRWTGQPPKQTKGGESLAASAASTCNVGVTVYNTGSLADAGTDLLPVEQPGTPASGVTVTFQEVPLIGAPVTVTTDANGIATLCGSAFTFAGVDGATQAFALQASVPGAQPEYSSPFVVAD